MAAGSCHHYPALSMSLWVPGLHRSYRQREDVSPMHSADHAFCDSRPGTGQGTGRVPMLTTLSHILPAEPRLSPTTIRAPFLGTAQHLQLTSTLAPALLGILSVPQSCQALCSLTAFTFAVSSTRNAASLSQDWLMLTLRLPRPPSYSLLLFRSTEFTILHNYPPHLHCLYLFTCLFSAYLIL